MILNERKPERQQNKFSFSEDEFRLPSGGFRSDKSG